MAAVWFVVTIPTPSYEQELDSPTVNNGKDNRSERSRTPVDGTLKSVQSTKSTSSEEAVSSKFSTIRASEIESKFYNLPAEAAVASCIETDLKTKLDELSVYDAVWNQTQNERYYQITFPAIRNDCESILSALAAIGIGSRPYTTLSVLPCTIHYNGQDDATEDESDSEPEIITDKSGERGLTYKSANSFVQSIKSRLTVAQVVEGVRGSAVLTFDFIMFVLLAGMLAALGLVEDSSVILVASMLVSPMMGPILAGTFGTVIRDRELQRLGVKNELIGLLLCLSSGFLFGIIYGSVEHWRSGFWLTSEMVARGQLRSLWVGILIALPSGAGVALSVLGGNAGSLVGVAISASLLPPVVNGGLLWAVALTKYIRWSIDESSVHLEPQENYVPSYSQNMAVEACALGAVSITLTIVNIICIFIMGIIVLKIKEVAPQSALTKRFWHRDIREVRNHNATLSKSDASDLSEKLLAELKAANTEDDDSVVMRNPNRRMSRFQRLMKEVEDDPVYRTVRCRSAYPNIEPQAHPTWHLGSLSNTGTTPEEWKSQEKRLIRFQRSISSPQGRDVEMTSKQKKRLLNEAPASLGNSPPASADATSHNRRLHFNFNVPHLHRFTVTRADENPLPPPRRSVKRKSQERDKHLAELHELVP